MKLYSDHDFFNASFIYNIHKSFGLKSPFESIITDLSCYWLYTTVFVPEICSWYLLIYLSPVCSLLLHLCWCVCQIILAGYYPPHSVTLPGLYTHSVGTMGKTTPTSCAHCQKSIIARGRALVSSLFSCKHCTARCVALYLDKYSYITRWIFN